MNIRAGLISAVGIFIISTALAQTSEDYPSKNWFNEDAQNQHVNGVSTTEAYEYLKGRESKTVLVAVIDSGIDIDHEDLKDKIWINTDEIPGNGIDDDKNGFIDDIHGWNFIGGKNGANVGPDNLEVTREYRRLKGQYEGKKAKKKKGYEYWLEIEKGYQEAFSKANDQLEFYINIKNAIDRYHPMIKAYLDVDELTLEAVRSIESPDSIVSVGAGFMGSILYMVGDTGMGELNAELDEAVSHYDTQVQFQYNLDYDPRTIIGDNPEDLSEVGYGNNDVKGTGTDNLHGTHVAGIIGASRDNSLGIDGITYDVKIMALRAVPDGDEHDKDVANAIRYAVDNGAQVINMSFGKGYSPHKDYVDKAVRYAEKHGVLLVHAAGNDGKNIDEKNFYPTKKLNNNKKAGNWIEVGASAWGDDDQLAASFSNYGQNSVDLFAPGVEIYSTAPGNEYKSLPGTSFASPVTAGVAALLLSYYPDLSATDLKDILMQSSRKFDGLMVVKPGSEDEKVDFSSLSVSGGIVNAFEAVKLADTWKISSK
ncbi:MAG: S8 family peptidase [Bacteroidota bacterium]